MRARFSGLGLLDALSAGCGLASFFVFLELLKAARSSQWAGFLARDLVGGSVAFGVYALVVAVLFLVVRRTCSRVLRGYSDPLAIFLGGLVVWALLSVHREQTPTLDDGIVGVALLGCGGALALGRGRWYSTDRFGLLLVMTGLCGVSALVASGEYYLFSVDRSWEVTRSSVIGIGCSGLLLVLLQCGSGRLRGLLLASLVGILFPPLIAWGLLHRAANSGDQARPNLVFIVADTLRAGYCGVNGGQVPTPNLERLAASGTLFEQSYSLAPWTLPSMTGLLSSQYPPSLTPGSGHGVWSLQMNRYAVDTREATLPMRLSEAGYATGAVTANAFLPSIPGAMAGFQEHISSHPILLREEGCLASLPFLGALVEAWFPALANIRPHNTTRSLDHYAEAFIERHRDQPFFLWVHYIDPHAPYDPPESLRRVHEGPWPFFHPYAGGEAWGLPILGKNFSVAEPDRDYVKSLYEGEVAYIDKFVGRLLDELKDSGIAENTYVCFTSDHGEELWDHGEWGHGHALYEEQLRVPLLFSGPGIKTQRVKEPVSAINLVPTLADLMSVQPASTWRGESLAPLLRGSAQAPPAKPIFAQGTTNKTETPMHAVIFEGYKLIRIAGTDSAQLFDLRDDPGERRNIASENPDRVSALENLLDTWLRSFPSFFEDETSPFNNELKEGLEGMGYF